jgi:hypothetical protein
MGYSITEETHNKIEASRQAGRLCSGGSRYCTTKASRKVLTETWLSKIGVGSSHVGKPLTLCTTHAKPYHVGYRGVNFIVLDVEKF